MRIISLVPSLTKTLFDLGVGDRIVGCTSYCVDPKKNTRKIPKIGGTKDPQIPLIKDLQPTHILVNSEENRVSDIFELKAIAPTLETFPREISAVPDMLREISLFLGFQGIKQLKTNDIATRIEAKISWLGTTKSTQQNRYLYLIWREPLMCAGPDTYISSLFNLIGYVNCANRADSRYPAVEISEIDQYDPHFIFLSSEPYPFRKRNAVEISKKIKNRPHFVKVDGKLFSWHGTTSLEALDYLEHIVASPDWWTGCSMV
jgi:iron complex transport system substrate-binding protein